MELGLRVTTADDTYQVTTTPWTIMLWERKYKTKASRIPSDGLGLEDLAFLAYTASGMSGRTIPASFDTWCQTVKSIEVAGGDDADPTLAAASVD